MEEEIDLMDYVKVIIKRWKIILCIFLVVLFVTAGISLTLPKTFQAQAVVKIGKIESKVLESITETIEILKGKFPGVTLSNPKGTDLLRIKAQGETPQRALDRANNAVDFLLSRHEKVYNEAKSSLEDKIATVEEETKDLQEKIKLEEKTYSEARARIIQSYMLNLEQVKSRERKLKEKESLFEPTQVETSPILPQNPIKPNIKLNLLVAAVLGLFVGVLIAFGKEWWEKEEETSHI